MVIRIILSIILILVFLSGVHSQETIITLEEGFKNPPEEAKPRTWWHWTNSNITKEGITKDLEWMKRVGIGGMQLADVAFGQGQTVADKLVFGSPGWLDAVRHSASEADRLKLEMALFSSAGWSLTGGPRVRPEQAMKKLVWSEMQIKGPTSFTGKLPPLPSGEGPIRNMTRGARPNPEEPGFCRDFTVLAFPTPSEEADTLLVTPVALTEKGAVNPAALLDDDLNSSQTIRSTTGTVWLQYTFEKPFTARAVTLASRAGIPAGKLKASEDGIGYHTLCLFPGAQLYRAGKVATYVFPATSARYFRFEFTGAPMKPAEVMAETPTSADSAYTFHEIRLHSGARIHRWEDKAGFYHLFNYDPVTLKGGSSSSGIDPDSILNLTPFLSPDGILRWKVPHGKWTILRFGYSLTGSKNRPAVPAGSGYEADKLSREHMQAYISDYMSPVAAALDSLYGKSLRYILLDSWEAGMQNWTDSMPGEFRRRRGYDLTPYLPCLSGRVVGNNEISDRVLWDFRRTLADMFAENHYGVLSEYLHRQGIKTYGEASGVSLEILEDALLCKKYMDIPMGEFWYRSLHPDLMYYQDIRGAASASHIYGKKIVAAESFTGGGFQSPFSLKKIADYWFTQGVNQLVFHTSAHQPLDSKPGNTMVGTHIHRNITWAEQAAPFMTYLSRVSWMLQQGHFMADLVYLLDEGAPSTMPIWGSGLIPAPPEGYDFDYINADALIHRMTVAADGRLTLPDGMNYAVLVLPNTDKMTLPVLRKIHALVKAGAVVTGPKPLCTPGFTGFPESETELHNLVQEIWGDLDGISRTRRLCGNGKVFLGTPLQTILESTRTAQDFIYAKPLNGKIDWIHRHSEETDIYFIVNPADRSTDTEISFRVEGMEPEIWDPGTGETTPISYKFSEGRSVVPLHLSEYQSLFIVFRNKSESIPQYVSPAKEEILSTLVSPWKVTFPSGSGAPENIVIDTLMSWTLHPDEGVKYFSGTAVYSRNLKIPGSWLKNAVHLQLDLGMVADLAEVIVNGTSAGILWKPPFRADITGSLQKGINQLEIRVTNEWTNRLIGDQSSPTGRKILNSPLFVREKNLPVSGLLGPVTLIRKFRYNN